MSQLIEPYINCCMVFKCTTYLDDQCNITFLIKLFTILFFSLITVTAFQTIGLAHFILLTVRPIYRTGTPLPSKNPILYIFSTKLRTEFFKHAAPSPFFSLQNAVYFIMIPFLVQYLYCLHFTYRVC
jgi:hypothetical protein